MSNKFEALKENVENSDSSEEENVCSNNVDLGPIEYPPDQHRLQHPYWLWYSKRPTTNVRNIQAQGTQGYSQALRLVAQFGTVEQWWAVYSHIVRLGDLSAHSDLHLFKLGIQPMWEDQANAKGGKWVIRLRKGQIGRSWENLCMAMLGEQFMVGNEICGAVVSVRYQEDLLSVWNRSSSDQASIARIRDTLRRILNLPPGIAMEYKTHVESLKYVSPPQLTGGKNIYSLAMSLQQFYSRSSFPQIEGFLGGNHYRSYNELKEGVSDWFNNLAAT